MALNKIDVISNLKIQISYFFLKSVQETNIRFFLYILILNPFNKLGRKPNRNTVFKNNSLKTCMFKI